MRIFIKASKHDAQSFRRIESNHFRAFHKSSISRKLNDTILIKLCVSVKNINILAYTHFKKYWTWYFRESLHFLKSKTQNGALQKQADRKFYLTRF